MEQKYYSARKGSQYLSLTNHPGELTELDIVANIHRMMEKDLDEDEEVSWKSLRLAARYFYEENIERILQMVRPGMELEEVSKEELEMENPDLSFEEWKLWEFPVVEWD